MSTVDVVEAENIEQFLISECRPGILLTRPFPVTREISVRSQLGGLPTLPLHVIWPRGKSYGQDVPMHFLAQIDCSELPRVDPRMPASGVLYFFAVNDEEQIWTEGEPRERVRVIYEPDVPLDVPPGPAPTDLPPMRGRTARDNPWEPAWLLPAEDGPSVFHSWPLIASRFDTWPDADNYRNLPFNDHERCARRVTAMRVGSVVVATGLPTRSDQVPAWETRIDQPPRLPGLGDVDPDRLEFPQLGIMIDRLSRIIARYFRVALDDLPGSAIHAKDWMQRARMIGLDNPPSAQDKEEFRHWLMQLTTDPALPSYFRSSWPDILTKGLLAAIAYIGGSVAGSLIPSSFYDALENHHLPFDQTFRIQQTRPRVQARVHQMLGHASMYQSGSPGPDEDMVCLLQLASDAGIEMVFGDLGSATFWITGADLEQCRFDRCWAVVEGG